MIAGLIGTVHGLAPDSILVNVHGVIYRVLTSSRTGEQSGGVGAPVELRTHLVVREDAQVLYGFLTENELTWFQTLIGINGVGPRLACAVLGRFSPDALLDAISAEDLDILSTVPGIGTGVEAGAWVPSPPGPANTTPSAVDSAVTAATSANTVVATRKFIETS